jgi:cytochrome c oxidase assembly protein subunit 15
MLKDEIGIFHACLAQAFLGLLVFLALATTNFWRSLANIGSSAECNSAGRTGQSPMFRKFAPLKTFAFAITIAIYAQLALGATMRHQHRDLAILDFPTANGAWTPAQPHLQRSMRGVMHAPYRM